jgi:hypothetical protein
MASSFAGMDLFGSGPHRFAMGAAGRLVVGALRPPAYDTHSVDMGATLELRIVQRGRLVAATTSALWTLVDAIRTQTELPRNGTLIDHHGRSWTNMTLIRFEVAGPIDRGRMVSMAYEAEYLRYGI